MTAAPAPADRGGAAGGLATAALLVSVVTAASRVTGFLRDAVTAAVFGAGADLDAYLVAGQVPNVVIALLGTATVTAAIPAVSRRVRGEDVTGGHRLFRTVCLVVLTALAVASLALAAAAPSLVHVLAPGFEPDQVALAGGLSRILLLSTVLVAGMNLVSALLQVHRRFFWPAAVGIVFNVVVVAMAVLLGRRLGVAALAWGFVLGSLLRVLMQLPSLRRTGFRWRGPVRLGDPGVAAIAGLLPVILLGHLASNVNTLVDRVVGSTLDDGAIAALNYAYRLVTLPHGLLVLALLQVLYPALGAAAGRRDEFRALTDRSGRVLVAVLVPVAGLLAALAVPIVTLVYGRGAFTAEDVARTAAGLAGYAPALVAMGVRDLALRGLYGMSDRWRPAAVTVAGMVVNVAADLTLGRRFGLPGLAVATSLSFTTAAVLSVWVLAGAHGGVGPRALLAALGRNLMAVVPAVVAAGAVLRLVGTASAADALLTVAVGGAAGLGVHVLVLRLLRAPELGEATALARQVAARMGRGRRPAGDPPSGPDG